VKIICCSGDSHTWGQGATGALAFLHNVVEAGTLRLMPFGPPSYVSLLRTYIKDKTGSYAEELYAEDLAEQYHLSMREDYAIIEEEPICFSTKAGFFRLEFMGQTETSKADIYIDGHFYQNLDLTVKDATNAYRLFSVSLDETVEEHQVEIRCVEGDVLIYRIENYYGEYAVVNCGVGSSSAEKYFDIYWDSHIIPCNPSIVVMEGHTINDWLSGNSPEVSEHVLIKMIGAIKELGAVPIFLSVSPIEGEQINDLGIDYQCYIDAGRRAAEVTNIPYIDTNTLLKKVQKETKLFDDNWHVNDLGHMIYAEEIIKALSNLDII